MLKQFGQLIFLVPTGGPEVACGHLATCACGGKLLRRGRRPEEGAEEAQREQRNAAALSS